MQVIVLSAVGLQEIPLNGHVTILAVIHTPVGVPFFSEITKHNTKLCYMHQSTMTSVEHYQW